MRRALAVALLVLTAAAAPAPAANRVVPVFGGEPPPAPAGDLVLPLLFGPFLAGDEVVFAERRADAVAVVADGPAGKRDLDASTAIDRTLEPLSVDLDVAEGRVALNTYRFTCNRDPACEKFRARTPDDHRTLVGPVSGPLARLSSTCGLSRADVAATAFIGPCHLRNNALELHEEGAPSREVAGDLASTPQVAGDFVARTILGPNVIPVGIEVLRRPALDPVYRVDAPVSEWELAPDGSVVYGLFETAKIGWSSPADPAVHLLDVPGWAIRIAGAAERIAVMLEPAFGGIARSKRLLVVDRAGAIRADHTEAAPIAGIAFDGARLAWARQPCSRQSIAVWDLSEPAPDLPGADCTMPDPGAGAVRLGRDRRATVTLTCPATAPTGCAGVASLSAYLRRRPSDRRRLRGSAAESFDLLPGGAKTIAVRVKRNGLRRFRSGQLRIEITLRRERDLTVRRPLRLR